ncbi:MAG: hypothetical protein KGN84_21270 [Acidobacteriota bacterium]|nr:hypothetical protein [Acidobacteriota bacterium]
MKSLRSLSPESADRLMAALRLDIPELLFRFQKMEDLSVRAVPIVRSRVGPGCEPVLTSYRGFMPLPSSLIDSLQHPVMIQVAPEMGLPRPLLPNDLVLLDRSEAVRASARGGGLWLVSEEGSIRIRYVKLGGTRVYLANENTSADPSRWTSVPVRGAAILHVILARVVWFSRSLGLEMADELDDAA